MVFLNYWKYSRWWFQIFVIFIPTWGHDPIWLIFFRWVVQPSTSIEYCWLRNVPSNKCIPQLRCSSRASWRNVVWWKLHNVRWKKCRRLWLGERNAAVGDGPGAILLQRYSNLTCSIVDQQSCFKHGPSETIRRNGWCCFLMWHLIYTPMFGGSITLRNPWKLLLCT